MENCFWLGFYVQGLRFLVFNCAFYGDSFVFTYHSQGYRFLGLLVGELIFIKPPCFEESEFIKCDKSHFDSIKELYTMELLRQIIQRSLSMNNGFNIVEALGNMQYLFNYLFTVFCDFLLLQDSVVFRSRILTFI